MASIASGEGPNGFSFDASFTMRPPDSCRACRMDLPGTYPASARMCSGICSTTFFFIDGEGTTEVCITNCLVALRLSQLAIPNRSKRHHVPDCLRIRVDEGSAPLLLRVVQVTHNCCFICS